MALEPQDRNGRVGHDKLIDTSGRVEFTSRIFVLTSHQKYMLGFPKLWKTFFAAPVSFNAEQEYNEAIATKMLSIMQMCSQSMSWVFLPAPSYPALCPQTP